MYKFLGFTSVLLIIIIFINNIQNIIIKTICYAIVFVISFNFYKRKFGFYNKNVKIDHKQKELIIKDLNSDQIGLNSFLPTSRIEMTISCRKLLNMDLLSKSDPYCLVKMKDSFDRNYIEIGRTETIDDNLNPEWVKKFIIDYNFETIQKIRFEVYDVDPDKDDFLGEFETTLAQIASHSGRQFVAKLSGIPNKDCGQIIIVTEELSNCRQIVEMKFRAKSLTELIWFTGNDPFLVFSRSNEDSSYSVVLKSEIIYSTQNPVWNTITTSSRTLCNGDYDRSIKIDCFDNRSDGNHQLIGTCFTTLRKLTQGIDVNKYQFMNSKNSKTGLLELISIKVTNSDSFLDYIRGGTQMHFAVAIDFTASNRTPTDPHSLHFLDKYGLRPNPYEMALRSVGEIIQYYTQTQNLAKFPAFGFGAKIPPNGEVSHQFALNGNPSHPYCNGIEEILNHYRNRVNSVTLSGPTNFSSVINNTTAIAERLQDGKNYFILLIITDGIISDMYQTKNAIINASKLPISIIIVGVGNADFAAMDELDSDDIRLSVDNRYAERDIVQFVPLNKYLSQNEPIVNSQTQQFQLAKEVLAEIPDQLTGYMKSKGFKPLLTTNSLETMPNAPPFSSK